MSDFADKQAQKTETRSNRRVVVYCMSIVLAMGGMAYAAVPLYDLFCRVTGFGGTTQVAASSDGIDVIDRKITVRFDANVEKGFAWSFAPEQRDVTLNLGETRIINYVAKNPTDKPLTGTASFNVTPQAAGAYFNKIQCFCFVETTLQPGEEMEMPVQFFVDPEIINYAETQNIRSITLSYTFFEQEPEPVARLDNTASTKEVVDEQGRL